VARGIIIGAREEDLGRNGHGTKLLLIRHGETVWNALGRQQGQLDTPLNERGIAQARRLGCALANRAVDRLYCSDLGRARQTAEAISDSLGLEAVCDARLRERHMGIAQGLTVEEFRLRHPVEYARFASGDADWVIPGGESLRQVHQRVVACVDDLVGRHAGETLAVVTHGGVLDRLFRYACGLDLGSPRRFSLFNASIGEFSAVPGRLKLERWGDTHHLEPFGAEDDW